MGKSKSGGTRGYIRGRIANDVYSIGKDGKGKKQQVIRSLAESVANPRTTAQMRGRMIMTTIMQAVSQLGMLVDHSFDGLPAGQPSISEFISRNYALIKADVAAHPSSDNTFGLNKYQEKGIKQGAWLLSDGKAEDVNVLTLTSDHKGFSVVGLAENATVGDLKQYMGITSDDYITLVRVFTNGYAAYARIQIGANVADTTVISAANVETLFTVEGNFTLTIAYDNGELSFKGSVACDFWGKIVSRKVGSGYEHNKASVENYGSDDPAFVADTALPTYPTGSERFLNGGEI